MLAIKYLADLQRSTLFCSVLNIKYIKYSLCCPNALQVQTCSLVRAHQRVKIKGGDVSRAGNNAACPFSLKCPSCLYIINLNLLCVLSTCVVWSLTNNSVCFIYQLHLTEAEQTNIFMYPQSVDHLFKCQTPSHPQASVRLRWGITVLANWACLSPVCCTNQAWPCVPVQTCTDMYNTV